MTTTRNRLDIANSVLLSNGERPITSLSSTQGALVLDCLREALQFVCTSNNWGELREPNEYAYSWSNDVATLNASVYRVSGVFWYSSPDGAAEADYDYPKYPVRFTTYDDFIQRPLEPYSSYSSRPDFYTLIGSNKVRLNPYPNDTGSRACIRFDVFKQVSLPSLDSSYFNCSDQFITLVQYKASALFALKFATDVQLAQILELEYEKHRRRLMIGDSSLPTGGYDVYYNNRRR